MNVSSFGEVASGGRLLEGIVWDPRLLCLYWVDILEGKVFFYSRGRAVEICHMIGYTSAVMLTSDANSLIVSRDRSLEIIRGGLVVDKIVDFPEPDSNRLNDCKITRNGEILAGTMEVEPTGLNGAYYRVSPEGVSCLTRGVGIANGSTELHDSILLTDSYVGTLSEFTKDKQGVPRQLIRTLTKEQLGGIPDGHCFDSAGMIWVALWGAGCVVKVDYTTWKVVAKVEVPRTNVSSCCIGALDGKSSLYVTYAESAPMADDGAVFKVSFSPGGLGAPYEGFPAYDLNTQ